LPENLVENWIEKRYLNENSVAKRFLNENSVEERLDRYFNEIGIKENWDFCRCSRFLDEIWNFGEKNY